MRSGEKEIEIPVSAVNTSGTNKKPGLVVLLGAISFSVLISVIGLIVVSYLLFSDKDEPILEPTGTDVSIETPVEEDLKDAPAGESDSETISVISGDYPFDMPENAPFDFDEMAQLSVKALDRYSVMYTVDGDRESFVQFIDPYLTLYLASSEYAFQKYNDTFKGVAPNLEYRESLTIRVVEKCADISASLSEKSCADVKMYGAVSPFTYTTSFYVNLDHLEFDPAFIIDVATHEVVHLLQYTYDEGYTSGSIPDWYKESMAVGLSLQADKKLELYMQDYSKHGAPEDLLELEIWYNLSGDTLESLEKKRTAYYVGGLFFDYQMKEVGLTDYLTIIGTLRKYDEYGMETIDNREEQDGFAVENPEYKKLMGIDPIDMYSEFVGNL